MVKKLIKLSIVLMLMGAIGMLLTYKNYYKSGNISETFKLEDKDYKNIVINLRSYDLDIINVQDKQEARVEFKGWNNSKNKSVFNVKVDGYTLKIISKDNRYLGINFGIYDFSIKVYVPSKEYNEIKIHIGTGDIKVKDIKSKSFDISSGVGEIILNNLKGEIVKARTGTGDIVSKEISSKINLYSGAGEVNLELDKIDNDINVSTGTGDINIAVKEPIYDAEIKSNSGIGDIDILEAYKNYVRLGEGTNKVNLKTGTGDIKLTEE